MRLPVPGAAERGAGTAPAVPPPRGELSSRVTAYLYGSTPSLPGPETVARADPLGDDLQLALHLCYELHYRGFAGVPDDMEWDPALLRLRALLERRFDAALRENRGRSRSVDDAFAEVLAEPADGTGISHFLLRDGTLKHLREHAVLRSIYQLREADPHLWVIPRLTGRAKAGMMTVQYDEFGCGRAERIHARLYADLMRDLALDPAYGHYLPLVGAEALAAVNLMSLLGLHRARRGALVGHFAALEVTSSPAASRIAAAMRRIGAGAAAIRFYDEHVEADAVHEQVVRREVVGGLLADEPALAAEIVFGVDATVWLEERLAAKVTAAWGTAASALRHPLGTNGTPQPQPQPLSPLPLTAM
ncbi:iron-containing redox enzyme family protein [Streptomyces sp. NPDC090108]|uniref:iron-containing redox enzyme family protein n=1 Tax=Streptomyces sp. NPDC090108 TaxID=3365947 RepID=UPI0038179FD3